jgi:hypothetical protein
MKGLALTAIALLAAACSSAPGPVGVSTASSVRNTPVVSAEPLGCPADEPAPRFQASSPSNRNLALVRLRSNDSSVVVRDITDISHPTTVGSLGNIYPAQFVNAAEVSYPAGGLVRTPLTGSPVTMVAACAGSAFAWSPDGTAAAFMAVTADPKIQQLHLVGDGQNSVVRGSVPALSFPVGCESRSCGDYWDIRLLYSPDGAYISLVEQLPVSAFRIWTSNGGLVQSGYTGRYTMSVWSGNTPGLIRPFGTRRAPQVGWIRPFGAKRAESVRPG